MTERDEQGRVVKLDVDDPSSREIGTDGIVRWVGRAACQRCQKDMGQIWDVICSVCHRPFCYEHAEALNGWWFCGDCRPTTRMNDHD